MKSLTVLQAVRLLKKKSRVQRIGLTFQKKVDMYKQGNPYHGRVQVVKGVHGYINIDYAKYMQKTKIKPRAWG